MFKRLVCFLTILLVGTVAYSQEHQNLLETPEGWRGELLTFPLSFAPSIDLTGIEDIRFAPGWSKPGSEDFWTYTFVWYIDKKHVMSEDFLSETMNIYFDGLMGVVAKDSGSIEKTEATFIKNGDSFKGLIKAYDAFFTKEVITLHVKVKEALCAEENKQMVTFQLSPKPYDDAIWDLFKEVRLKKLCP
ncbi:MAG: hypothetical protein AAFX87_14020 [Bacteroidota bacterium]